MKAEFGVLEFLAMLLAAFLVGIVAGVTSNEQSTMRDCASMGKFRIESKVFQCHKEPQDGR